MTAVLDTPIYYRVKSHREEVAKAEAIIHNATSLAIANIFDAEHSKSKALLQKHLMPTKKRSIFDRVRESYNTIKIELALGATGVVGATVWGMVELMN